MTIDLSHFDPRARPADFAILRRPVPLPTAIVRCRCGQGTFAGTSGNDKDAPKNEPARAGGSTGRGRRIFGEVMCGSA